MEVTREWRLSLEPVLWDRSTVCLAGWWINMCDSGPRQDWALCHMKSHVPVRSCICIRCRVSRRRMPYRRRRLYQRHGLSRAVLLCLRPQWKIPYIMGRETAEKGQCD
ncbi:hypothetical protein Bbelb_016740 [Branchiostoma belcheri]|nr:hypothetical protein Bbelb_016740 [Branchiostoma belcheri]